MKFCFSTLGCFERSLSEVLLLAKRYDMSAVEIRGLGGIMENDQIPDFFPENRQDTRERLLETGIVPLVLGTSCAFHDTAKYDSHIEAGKRAIDIANEIGFSAIRVFGNSIRGEESDCIERVARGIRTLCDYAEGTDVSVLLEVHGDFNTEARLSAVVERCKESAHFGILWDVCHTRETYAKHWRDCYDTFAPYIRHIHLKDIDGNVHKLPGEGTLPLSDMVTYMDKNGYDGYFSLEWEKKWHPELPEIEEALSAMKKLF